jgi:hypothetical protein
MTAGDSLFNMVKTDFVLTYHHKYQYNDLQGQTPWEREVFLSLLENQLKKEDPGALSSYGYQTTNKGNVVDEKFSSSVKDDAKRLRAMATNRPVSDSQRRTSEQSLRGRKLAEGIQTPSMSSSKKPVMAAPKIDTAAAKAKSKADSQKEFYINSKGVKVYR